MTQTVREFITQSYKLINPSSPTQALQGDDLSTGILVLNQILRSFASTGLMLTIAKTVNVTVGIGQQFVVIGAPDFIPTPDIILGRLASIESAWLLLDNVDYPLVPYSRDQFLSSFRYEPLQGLPRFVIMFADTDVVRLQIYPAPSQEYEFYLRGKFQLTTLTANDNMGSLPQYTQLYMLLKVAQYLALFNGRSEAWTPSLEKALIEQEDIIKASSEVNLSIIADKDSMLNGANRVRAGV